MNEPITQMVITAYVLCNYASRCVIGSLIYNLNDKYTCRYI